MAPRYGENNFGGPSSDTPGNRTQSKLAAELETKQRGLSDVVATGGRKTDNPDVFTGRGNTKTPGVAVGNKNPNASPAKVPPNNRPVTTRG